MIILDSSVAPAAITLDGLAMTPTDIGAIKETQRKYELLHFGFEAQLEPCREVKWSRQIYIHRDTSQGSSFFQPRFIVLSFGHV
jgi:hypothetical protein